MKQAKDWREVLNRTEQLGIHELDPTECAWVLRQCASSKALPEGRRLHSLLLRAGLHTTTFLGNLLVQLYSTCACLDDAKSAFDKLHRPNVFSWNNLMFAYNRSGLLPEARNIFMSATERPVVTWNAMIWAYAQNGYLQESKSVFGRMLHRDVVSWNTVLSCYSQLQPLDQTADFFILMPGRDFDLVELSPSGALGSRGLVAEAKSLFDEMPEKDIVAGNPMINAYAQYGHIDEAASMYKNMNQLNVINHTSMMVSFIQTGQLDQARKFFDCMSESSVVTWKLESLCTGRENAPGGREMPTRDVISFNSMLTGFAQIGEVEQAVDFTTECEHCEALEKTSFNQLATTKSFKLA